MLIVLLQGFPSFLPQSLSRAPLKLSELELTRFGVVLAHDLATLGEAHGWMVREAQWYEAIAATGGYWNWDMRNTATWSAFNLVAIAAFLSQDSWLPLQKLPSCEPPETPCASGKGDFFHPLEVEHFGKTLGNKTMGNHGKPTSVCLIVLPVWDLLKGNLQNAYITLW